MERSRGSIEMRQPETIVKVDDFFTGGELDAPFAA